MRDCCNNKLQEAEVVANGCWCCHIAGAGLLGLRCLLASLIALVHRVVCMPHSVPIAAEHINLCKPSNRRQVQPSSASLGQRGVLLLVLWMHLRGQSSMVFIHQSLVATIGE